MPGIREYEGPGAVRASWLGQKAGQLEPDDNLPGWGFGDNSKFSGMLMDLGRALLDGVSPLN